jgi:hypothetical protein
VTGYADAYDSGIERVLLGHTVLDVCYDCH